MNKLVGSPFSSEPSQNNLIKLIKQERKPDMVLTILVLGS